MTPAVRGSLTPDTLGNDLIWLRNDDGQFVPVLRDSTLEQFREWLRSRQRPEAGDEPEYSVTAVRLAGEADDERARLTARITVQINRDGWVRVPLRMHEAVLRDTAYEGDGEQTFAELHPEDGYRWWFRGKGLHQMTFTINVPVRRQLPSRRLQLSLPPSAVSDLQVFVPDQRLTVRVLDQSSVRTRPDDDGTRIEVFGFGERLNISWQPLPGPTQVETILQAATLIGVEFTGETILLKANQSVQAAQGSFDRVSLRLPPGFELLDVEAREYRDHEFDPDSPERITVLLNEPTSGPVELKWTMRADFPRRGGRLILDGFEVENARRQSGHIAIGRLEGYRIAKQDDADRFVHRINVSDLRSFSDLRSLLGTGQLTSGYRILKQPFRLELNLEPIEPGFTAEPRLLLHFGRDAATLEGVFRVDVFRGVLDELEIRWPTFESEGWTLEPFEAPGLIDRVSVSGGDEEDGRIQIRLADRKAGSFEIPIRARRALAEQDEPVSLSLPTVVASSRLPTTLVVANDDAVETELVPLGPTSARPRQVRAQMRIPEEWRELRRSELRIDSAVQQFAARVTVHPRRVRTETEIAARLRDGRLHVEQELRFQVAYERLTQVRLTVPQSVRDRVQFFDEEGVQHIPAGSGPDEGDSRQVRLNLNEPRIGRFSIRAVYTMDLPQELAPGRDVNVDVPLIRTADDDFTTSRFVLLEADSVEAATADESWQRQVTIDGNPTWSAPGARRYMPLVLSHGTSYTSQEYTVSKALIRGVFDHAGQARFRAQYRMQGTVSRVLLTMPDGIEPDRSDVWWGAQPVPADRIVETAPGSGEYRIEIAEQPVSGDFLLTIGYHGAAGPFRWVNRVNVPTPQLAPTVWVAQTLCELVFPYDQHLFSNPEAWSPQFRWQRGTLLWSRQSYPQYASPESWLGPVEQPPPSVDFDVGNSYLFTRFARPRELRFQTMSRPMIFLFGAGLALALGFVLIEVRATQHVLTVLVLAFAVAVASLWFISPIRLLLQPGIIGVLLALAAALIDSHFRRKQGPAVLTLSADSHLSHPGSSVHRPQNYVGSEEATAIRLSLPAEPASSVSEHRQ